MKDKNRFSILLEHLMAIAELKNSILAKAVQYDDSYISKWISGKLLPTEKNHENTLQAISHCIVEALSEESTAQLLQEYQLQDINDLETAIYDNLESVYICKRITKLNRYRSSSKNFLLSGAYIRPVHF